MDDDLDSGIDGERHRNFLLHDDRAISKAEEELNENPEKRYFPILQIANMFVKHTYNIKYDICAWCVRIKNRLKTQFL